MYEIISIGVLSIVFMSIMFVQNKSNSKRLEEEIFELKKEIEEKRELNAKASLIENENETLKSEISTMSQTIESLKTEISKKEIMIAEAKKDEESYMAKINGGLDKVEKESVKIEELQRQIDNHKREIISLNSTLKEKEYLQEQAEAIYTNKQSLLSKEKENISKDLLSRNTEITELKAKTLLLTDENNALKIQESKLQTDLNSSNSNLTKNTKNTDKQISGLDTEIAENKEKIESLIHKNIELNSLNSKLMADLEAQEENQKKLEKAFGEQTKKFELKVGDIMQQALDSKLKKFDASSMKSLDETLKPFKENLEQFRKKVEDSQESSTKKFAELSKEIEQVTKAGIHISKEAENLTQALKGKKQTQGSWGEMILETVLEYSGLLKGIHFDTQQSYKDESGDIKRPDVVIKLPQNRSMIIDSKVSLNDYDRYIRAETDEERLIASKGVAKAFRDQIDNLDSKDYSHYKIGTLQYVFMFVPVEGAFSLAVQEDPSLYEYALKKHIAIVNPSTLTVSLRTIYLYWQSEQSSTLAIKLFNEAGKLYDKMHTFTENFVKIGSQLQTVNKTYESATKQLTEGTGNLLGRVENLKKLGARTSKSLSTSKIEYQDFDVNDAEVEIMEDNAHEYIEN
jgi:DNA recombination protein RmuC